MIEGAEDKVCTDAAFLSRHEDVLASHGNKEQWKPKRAFNSSSGGGGFKSEDMEEGRRGYKENVKKLRENEYWNVHVHLELLVKTGLKSLLRAYQRKTRRILLKKNLTKYSIY